MQNSWTPLSAKRIVDVNPSLIGDCSIRSQVKERRVLVRSDGAAKEALSIHHGLGNVGYRRRTQLRCRRTAVSTLRAAQYLHREVMRRKTTCPCRQTCFRAANLPRSSEQFGAPARCLVSCVRLPASARSCLASLPPGPRLSQLHAHHPIPPHRCTRPRLFALALLMEIPLR